MKQTLKKHTLNAACAAMLALPLLTAGCTSSKVSNTPTQGVGQQLIDLNRAYQEGIISEDQYNKLKKEIIRKND